MRQRCLSSRRRLFARFVHRIAIVLSLARSRLESSFHASKRRVRSGGVAVCAVVGVRVRRLGRQRQLPVAHLHLDACRVRMRCSALSFFVIEIVSQHAVSDEVGTQTFVNDTLATPVRSQRSFDRNRANTISECVQADIAMRRRRVSPIAALFRLK